MDSYRPIATTSILSKVYEKSVSHKLSPDLKEMWFIACCSVSYWEGLGCIDALFTISHHLHKSLEAWMESYIVQLDFSAAFHRVSHSGLLFKLKSIGVGSRVLSICTEFLTDLRQRVVVDGAASEWISIQ